MPLLLSEHLSKEFKAFWHLLYLKASFRVTEVRRWHYTAKQITLKSTLKSSFNGLFFTFGRELFLKKPIIILTLSSRNWHVFSFLKVWPSIASCADKVERAFRVRLSSLSVMDLCNKKWMWIFYNEVRRIFMLSFLHGIVMHEFSDWLFQIRHNLFFQAQTLTIKETPLFLYYCILKFILLNPNKIFRSSLERV